MQADIVPARHRHDADFGSLNTTWLRSFANDFDPRTIHFGALRVFNDRPSCRGRRYSAEALEATRG